MEKKTSKYNDKDKPNWDWTHVECYLKTVEANRKSTIWNLAPSIILTNPSTDSSGPNVRLYIDTEKSLQYSNELGWNWHKSWNIPNISLRLQIKDQNSGDFLLSPRNLYAQIFAVKKNTQNQKTDRMTLIDVGIRGESKMEMIDGQVYFSAIKFSSTTYNNEGINFNLLIVLYINQGEFQKPKVLTAVISPPIFVDSRRSARDYQQKKFSSFVQPFAYDNLEKQFIKRQNKSKCQSEIVIKNDPQGFYNYITAPNIRHKVKHPVFLTIKFSNCVKIYYNTKLVQNASVNELLQNMQSKLLKENKSKQKNDVQIATNIQEKHFVFVITNLTDSLKRKKVLESIETMQNQFIGISCGPEELLDCLVPMGSVQSLKKGYKETYESLITICQNYEPEYQEQSQDEYYSQGYEESEKSSIKKKKQQAPRNTRNKTTIISNKSQNIPQQKSLKVQKNDQIILKKEQLFDSQFQAPVFFNNQNQENARKNAAATSAFNRAVGFRNVSSNLAENNPIFDTTQLNKAFANNLANVQFGQQSMNSNQANFPEKNSGFKSTKTQANVLGRDNHLQQGMNPSLSINSLQSLTSSQGQNNQNIGSFGGMGGLSGNGFGASSMYDNLMYSNLNLSNWLTSVKNNNNSLYDSMHSHSLSDQIMHKSNIDRYIQNEQQQKRLQLGRMPLQNQQQQSIVCLIQQIGLYKELLSQVTYQNQLLSRDITFKQQQQNPISQYGGLQGLSYMNGLNGLNLSNLGGLGNLGNLGGLGGNGISGMNNNGLPGMNNNGLPGMNNISSLSGVPQGMMANVQFLSQDIMGSQMNLVNNMMLNQQGNNRQIDQSNKDKESLPIQQNTLSTNLPNIPQNPISQALSASNVNQNLVTRIQNLSSSSGGVAVNGGGVKQGSMMGMGIDPQNFETIKNMVLQSIKKQNQQKQRERQQSLK